MELAKPNEEGGDVAVLKSEGYTIKSEIGSGSFGKVYLAEKRNEDKSTTKLAVKVIKTTEASENYLQKFLTREILIWPDLHHCCIVRAENIFFSSRKVYAFMELCPNGTVSTFLQERGSPPEGTVKKWMSCLFKALKYIHIRFIAHRDVKCDNLLLTSNMELKLGDFGFTRICSKVQSKKNLSHTFCGSMAYMAPEILKGVPYNPLKSDIWSSGVCFFEILNNAVPFSATNPLKMYEHQTRRTFEFSDSYKKNVPKICRKLMSRLLEPDSKVRTTAEKALRSSWFRYSAEKSN